MPSPAGTSINPLDHRHDLRLRALPPAALAALERYAVPPRLLAHLLLVHDVAVQLLEGIQGHGCAGQIDFAAVGFGAATHDIGKVEYSDELTGPGGQHAIRGSQLLLQVGIDPQLARFATTHEHWRAQSDIQLEDLLVALADTCWKGKRDQDLEMRVAEQVAIRSGQDRWTIWLALDNLLERIATDADERLLWQAQFAIQA